jgi:nucleoid DNA-binding protein
MRASVRNGRLELAGRVQAALCLSTKKEAEHVVNAVVSCLECTLLNHLATDGFILKLNSFGKFSVRHKPGTLRKIPFTGETILTKSKRKVRFVCLGGAPPKGAPRMNRSKPAETRESLRRRGAASLSPLPPRRSTAWTLWDRQLHGQTR